MVTIASTAARSHWSATLDTARAEPVTITERGVKTAVLMEADLAARALAALEDAEDIAAADRAMGAIAAGEATLPLAQVARELGIELE